MKSIKNFLKGKKTYLVGVNAILGAVIAWSTDNLELSAVVQVVVASVLAMTVRAGVSDLKDEAGL